MDTGNMHKKNSVKSVRVVSEICSRTDRQTDRQMVIAIHRLPYRVRSN